MPLAIHHGEHARGARMLVLAQPSLLQESIQELLRQEPGLEILALETDPAQAVGRVKETHPDVVVLTDAEAATGLGLELLGMVREGFHLRIVEVDQASNTLCLYCGERQPIREVGDLVDTVQHICDTLSREGQVPLSAAEAAQ